MMLQGTQCANVPLRPCFSSVWMCPTVQPLGPFETFQQQTLSLDPPMPLLSGCTHISKGHSQLSVCRPHWPWLTKCDFLLFSPVLPDSGRPSLLVPTRTPSRPLSTQGPGGSCIVRCLGDSSSPSSHTNPKSTARSPFTEVIGSKVSLCLLLLGKAGPLCLHEIPW